MTTIRDLIKTALQRPGGEPRGTDDMAAEFIQRAAKGCEGMPKGITAEAVVAECKRMAKEGLIVLRGVNWEWVPQHAMVKRSEQKELF